MVDVFHCHCAADFQILVLGGVVELQAMLERNQNADGARDLLERLSLELRPRPGSRDGLPDHGALPDVLFRLPAGEEFHRGLPLLERDLFLDLVLVRTLSRAVLEQDRRAAPRRGAFPVVLRLDQHRRQVSAKQVPVRPLISGTFPSGWENNHAANLAFRIEA